MIVILPSTQTLYHAHRELDTYPISTSKFGLGQQQDSYQTPTGTHQIHSIIGLECPIFTQFIARKKVTTIAPSSWPEHLDTDLILSKIIRLEGMDEGHNKGEGVDSFARYIYIHGTNHEKLIGQPASIGCIRMKNEDIEILARKVCIHEKVYIGEQYREQIKQHHLSSTT